MQLLREGTAITIQFGPFVDKTDGVTLKTDSTTITDIDHGTTGIFLSKAGATAAIRHATVTASVADAYGMMKVTLDTTDTNTAGQLDVAFAKAATYLPVHKSFQIVEAAVFDMLYATSATGYIADQAVNATKWAGTSITATSIPVATAAGASGGLLISGSNAGTTTLGALTVTGETTLTGAVAATNASNDLRGILLQATQTGVTIPTVTTLTNLPAITANWLTAAGIAASALNGKGDWNIGKTGYALTATTGLGNQTANITGNLSGSVGSVTGAVGSVTGLTASDVGAIKTKTDFLPSVTAGGTGGLFIAGTNAATTVTTALTTTFTGNLTGSVGSVTGAVGSVTGAVGSVTAGVTLANGAHGGAAATMQLGGAGGLTSTVTGNLTGSVGSVTGAVGSVTGTVGSVTGAVGSVAGNVGGNVVGSVASVTAAVSITAAAVDLIWDEATSGHTTAGTTGKALTDASAAGNPWAALTASNTDAGSFGLALGTTLQTTLTTIDDLIDTEIAAIKSDTAAILLDTGTDGVVVAAASKTGYTLTATTGLGNQTADITGSLSGSVGSVTGAVGSVTGLTAANLDATISSRMATYTQPTGFLAATFPAGTVANTTNITAGTLTTVTNLTTNNDKTGYRLSATGVDDVLDEVVEGAVTLRESVRLANSALGGKASGLASTSVAYRDLADTKDRLAATVDADGNRSAVTRDLT